MASVTDMRHRHAQLLRGDGTGHGRGDVADHQAQRAALAQQQLLVADHDGRRLLGLRARADLEIDVRIGNAELAEEVTRHALVVMLAGMHQAHAQAAAGPLPRLHRAQDRRDLHEVGPRAGNDVDQRFGRFHHFGACKERARQVSQATRPSRPAVSAIAGAMGR
jgi:hypothetical protein